MNINYKDLKKMIKEAKEKKINEQAPTPMPSLQPAALANLISGITKLAAKDMAAAKAFLSKTPDAAKAIRDQLNLMFPEERQEPVTSAEPTAAQPQTTTAPAATGNLATSGE